MYRNKWNHNLYTLIKDSGAFVTLARQDGTELSITKQEFLFSYQEVKDES